MDRIDVLAAAEPGAVFLLNTPFGPDEILGPHPAAKRKKPLSEEIAVLRD